MPARIWRVFLIVLAFFYIGCVILAIIVLSFQAIKFLSPIVIRIWLPIVALPTAWLLFILRGRHRFIYGFVEIIIGVVAIANGFSGVHAFVSLVSTGDGGITSSQLTPTLAIVGAIYIVIRGLDNMDQGMKAFVTSIINPFDPYASEFYWEVIVKGKFARHKRSIVYRKLAYRYAKSLFNNRGIEPITIERLRLSFHGIRTLPYKKGRFFARGWSIQRRREWSQRRS